MKQLLDDSGMPIDGSEFLRNSPQENPVFAATWRGVRTILCNYAEITGTPLTQMEALEIMLLAAQAHQMDPATAREFAVLAAERFGVLTLRN